MNSDPSQPIITAGELRDIVSGPVNNLQQAQQEARTVTDSAEAAAESVRTARADIHNVLGGLSLERAGIRIQLGTSLSEFRSGGMLLGLPPYLDPPYEVPTKEPLDGREGRIFRYDVAQDGSVLALVDMRPRNLRERLGKWLALSPHSGYWLNLTDPDTVFDISRPNTKR